MIQIGTLVTCLASKKATEEDEPSETLRFDKYLERWAEIPNSVLIACCNKWIDNNTFFPEINAILDLAKPIMERRNATLIRLKALASYEMIEAPKKSDLTKEQRAELIARTTRLGKTKDNENGTI